MASSRRVVKLPEQLANQIAAGEVVARPASVIKELLENAIDAGARTILVEIDGGGVDRMQVVDDGVGMDADDAVMALERHATSKLARVEDLQAIATFGFRGEALPSIASVSRFALRTRRADAEAGVALRCEGGGPPSVAPWGGAPGTALEVADLFYNVPARRKFLRAMSTESAHVGDVVRAVALSQPGVTLELTRDGRRSKRWLRVDSREERVRAVLDDLDLVHCQGERGPVAVDAYLSRPDRARSGAGGLHLYVCGRVVQDRALARAVASAYGDALERGRFPVGAVFLSLPLDLVDVNVHPQKAEVRFAHARAVAEALHSVVAMRFGSAHRQGRSAAASAGAGTRPRAPAPRESSEPSWQWSGPVVARPELRAAEPRMPRPEPARDVPEPARETLRHVGDAGAWMIVEDDDGVRFVDPLRAARALVAARAAREWAEGGLRAQPLLFPCEIAPAEPLASAVALAARFGFELRPNGPRVHVHTVPRLFAGHDPERLLVPLADALSRGADPEREAAALFDAMCAAVTSAPDRQVLCRDLAARTDALDAATVKRVTWEELEGSP